MDGGMPLIPPASQQAMEGMGGGGGGGSNIRSAALKALTEANLVFHGFAVKGPGGNPGGYNDLEFTRGGDSVECNHIWWCCLQPTCLLCGYVKFFQIDAGCIQAGTEEGGKPVFFGSGMHCIPTFDLKMSDAGPKRTSEVEALIHGVKGIVTVKQGYVGLVFKSGEPLVLPPGMHQWNDPDVLWSGSLDLGHPVVSIGPYTLVTVEEGYVAITSDNGQQRILAGGKSYMLTHQNWKFQCFLTLKMQTMRVPNFRVTTGDNITLRVDANVNWEITNPDVAAAKNIELTKYKDPLQLMRDDVNLQVTSSLAALIGNIKYGSQGSKGVVNASDTGAVNQEKTEADDSDDENDKADSYSRLKLFNTDYLQAAVDDANSITQKYGVQVLSINVVAAMPADAELMQIMTGGAVASMLAQEKAKNTRADEKAELISAEMRAQVAEANAKVNIIQAEAAAEVLRIKAAAEQERAKTQAEADLAGVAAVAEATKIKANAEGEAEKIRGEAAKEAGMALEQSSVATSLAKLDMAYQPFQKLSSNTFFFGLKGDTMPSAAYMPGLGPLQ